VRGSAVGISHGLARRERFDACTALLAVVAVANNARDRTPENVDLDASARAPGFRSSCHWLFLSQRRRALRVADEWTHGAAPNRTRLVERWVSPRARTPSSGMRRAPRGSWPAREPAHTAPGPRPRAPLVARRRPERPSRTSSRRAFDRPRAPPALRALRRAHAPRRARGRGSS